MAPIHAYAVGKSHALAASELFVKNEKPQFDIISLLPSVIVGKNELHTTKEEVVASVNSVILGPLLDRKAEILLGQSVHVNDVAKAHIDSLNPSIPGNTRLMVSSEGIQGTT